MMIAVALVLLVIVASDNVRCDTGVVGDVPSDNY